MATNYFCNGNYIAANRSCGYSCQPQYQAPQAYSLIGPAGPQGPQGRQGQQGPQGPRGATGPAGPAGLAATVSVEAAASVPFGVDPIVENVGTPQAAVLRFAIPAGMPGDKGETGPKGDKGERGPKGDTGPAAVKAFAQLNSIIASADLPKGEKVKVPLQYGGEFENVEWSSGTVTITEAGYYSLFYAMYPFVILAADYADLIFSVRVNGVEISQTTSYNRVLKGTTPVKIYGSTIVKLNKGDVVDLTFMCNDDARFFFGTDNISSLFVYKIA